MRLPPDCLVLVADGRKMLLLRNRGSATEPELVVEFGEEMPNPPDHEQKSDLAGQRPAIGSGQASVGETDYHQQTEDDFARHAAEHVNKLALRNELDALIVVAARRTLGQLRRHFHKEVQGRILAEIDKALTGVPTDRIAKAILGLEAVS